MKPQHAIDTLVFNSAFPILDNEFDTESEVRANLNFMSEHDAEGRRSTPSYEDATDILD